MSKAIALLTALLLVVACTPGVEQHAHPRRPAPPPSPVLPLQDRDFLERAAEGSNAEIKTGGLTLSRAEGAEVKAFGQQMVEDHRRINQALASIATRRHIALPTSLGEHQAGYDRLVDLHRARFDEEYLQVMVEDHDAAAELFRSEASGGADAELRAFAAATLPLIESHLAHAKALAGPKPPPAP